jgi:hypothetical protein
MLRLFPQGLRLEAEDGADAIHVLRDQAVPSLHLVDGLLARRVLSLRRPRKLALRLEPEGFRALRRWLGPADGLRIALRGRLSYALPIRTLFLLSSIPLPRISWRNCGRSFGAASAISQAHGPAPEPGCGWMRLPAGCCCPRLLLVPGAGG